MEQEAKRKDGKDEGRDGEKWVHDSSVNHKGKVPLRASTGVWKASLFIITIEFSERLSYFGIATNLISYLTNVLHQDLETAAKNVNYWAGVTTIMPLAGGFLADAYFGRFTMGLSLLTMSEFIPIIKPCNARVCHKPRKIHEVLFFLALYFISLGTGGHKPCLESFGADQFDDDHLEERKKKMSYFNWWNFALCCGLLLGVIVIVYVQDKVSWGVADLILTIVMAVTILTFYMGKVYYRYRLPVGSPLTPLLQVLVAAIRKRKLPYPSNPSLLYEVPRLKLSQGRLLCHTSRLRFLDKAAIVEDRENASTEKTHNPWRLATVTKVEEMKLVLSMIPIWLTSLIFGVGVAQASTFFVKQAATMDRRITHNFDIPAASIYSLTAVGMMVSVTIYEKILVPFLRKVTSNERGINILQRIGIGMIFSTLSMVAAACVEMRRLKAVEKEIMQGGKQVALSMSVFWLAPQYLINGLGDGFALVGLQEYFYDQAPDSMRSLGIAFYLSVIGVGSFLSSFLIIIVDHITRKGGKSWIGKDLNMSRLDNFYWMLAALNLLNFCAYIFLARSYTYKNVERGILVPDCPKSDEADLIV
ncbi:protein NRT1/ PTR FAMILY 5.6-like isoform X2 [Herrania umbratica]|uniref:Protein NRT1/ PTR FAMILY 5.6-like isoform X2 n=1 Tax=Herrania umbratica TaxID=108875 RepID=A0A6J1B7Z2_9ROSI|nr:protein NRT1/ PTR FAMILY 5.6-like isoform X2 [Herrania umbratica]